MPRDDEVSRIGARTAKVASTILAGRAFALLLSGITFIIVARLLGPSTYGIYTLAVAIAGFFGSVGDFGIGTMFNKFISEHLASNERNKIADLIYNGLALALIVGIVLTAITIALSGLLAGFVLHNASYTYVIQIAALTIITGVLYSVVYSALIGFSKSKHIAYVTVVQTVVQSAFSLALILTGFGVISPIVGVVIGFTAGVATALYLIKVKNGVGTGKISLSRIGELLNFSAPMGASNMLNFIATNLTLIVLGLFAAVAIVGNFGVALKTSNIFNLIIDSVGLSMLPLLSTAKSNKRIGGGVAKVFNYAVYIAFLLASPVMLSLAILSRPFTYTVFSGVYSSAPTYLSIMAVGVLLAIVGAYTTTLLVSASKVRKILKYNIAVAIIQIVSIALLIPLLKGIGAAVLLFVITPIATSAIFAYGARANLGVSQNIGRVVRTVISALISALFLLPLMLIMGTNYIPLLVVGAVEQLLLYPAILAKLGGVGRKDLQLIGDFTSSIPFLNSAVSAMVRYASVFVSRGHS